MREQARNVATVRYNPQTMLDKGSDGAEQLAAVTVRQRAVYLEAGDEAGVSLGRLPCHDRSFRHRSETATLAPGRRRKVA